MQQTKRLLLLNIVFLIWTSIFNHSEAQELQPHSVIIRSFYQKDNEIPPFTNHSYNIFESTQFQELYYPPFRFASTTFDEEVSLNIPLSTLTKSFGSLSEVFLKEKGVLENAFIFYKNSEYGKAEAKLLSILPSHSDIGEKATLLLAWTKYHKQQPDAALSYAKAGFEAKHSAVALESFYLASLILMNSQAWEEIVAIYQKHAHSRVKYFWDTRFSLIQAIALSSLRRWKAVNDFIHHMEVDRYAHSKNFYKFYEIAGIAFFKRKQFEDSLTNSKTAYNLNPDLNYRRKLNRVIAWQSYFLNQYSVAVNLIEKSLPLAQIEYSDEIKYLKLACHLKLGQEPQTKAIFKTITPKSIFYKYAAFLIQTQSGKLKTDPELSNIIKNIRYDFPEMAFKSALQKGNRAFRTSQYEKAGKHYLQALSADVNSSEYVLAQYNLGLTHLKLQQFEKARLGFVNLLQSMPSHNIDLLNYHLLFSLNGLKQRHLFLDRFDRVDLTRISKNQAYELQFMRGNMLLADGNFKKASTTFFQLWKQSGQVDAYESGVGALFKDHNFVAALDFLKKNPSYRSEQLFALEIRSLLGLDKPKQALKRLNQAKYKDDGMIELQLEVLMANQLYGKVVKHVTRQLNRSLKSQKRLLFYLSLANAHFYLKQYASSKNQFYKALSLADDPLKKSLIQYNIALVAYYSKDFQSFIKGTKMILAKSKLSPEIRYNLTQLLVDYYQQNKQHQKADEILVSYLSQHSFRKIETKHKRIQLFYQNHSYEQCFELAKSENTDEDILQRRNRLILFGYCGNNIQNESVVIDSISKELSTPNVTYRKSEMEFVIAQAYFKLGQYSKSKLLTEDLTKSDLDKETASKNHMLLINNLVKLKEFDSADQEIGDPNQYRQTVHYSEALKLKAEIDAVHGKTDGSIKALLRIYYLPSTSEEEKLKSLLRVCEILIESERQIEARKYWQRIDAKAISKDPDNFQRYQHLEDNLKAP